MHNSWKKHRDICLVSHALCSWGRAEAARHFVSQLLLVLAFLHGSLHAVAPQIHLNYALLCFLRCRWPSSSSSSSFFLSWSSHSGHGEMVSVIKGLGTLCIKRVREFFILTAMMRSFFFLCLSLSACCECWVVSALLIFYLKVSWPVHSHRG